MGNFMVQREFYDDEGKPYTAMRVNTIYLIGFVFIGSLLLAALIFLLSYIHEKRKQRARHQRMSQHGKRHKTINS